MLLLEDRQNGIFLITRSFFIYEHAPDILQFVAILGVFIDFFILSVSLVQKDLNTAV